MHVFIVTAGYDHTIRFWEAPSGRCYRTLQYPDSQVNQLAISPDKRFIAAAGNPHVRLFDANSTNPNPVTSWEGHTSSVTAVGFQKDGKWIYTGSEDGTVKIWDMRAPGCQRDYESRSAVNTVVLHPNQGELISGDQGGNMRVWDLAANTCSCELVPAGDVAIRSVTVAADASLVAAANNNGTCFVWRLGKAHDLTTHFEPHHMLAAHSRYVLKALLSPDVKWLATMSADHTTKLWDTQTFELARTLSGHQRWVWDGVFSADSAYLVTASSDQTARLWDLERGETIRHYTGHAKAVVCVTLNDSAPEPSADELPAPEGMPPPSAAAAAASMQPLPPG
mmetsp:Transcript_16996/g.43934  ORF Transcript_16996/g.43934 Transcript_16996/m.43934 type:complete len:337 (+) Transcript_16996:192-1202(+)|eukprot:CAMPEP_0119413306 /NCGR_PEP_ID=MMETSP1335-20130426/5439_1 /TAXON_ID=259385 /ORGANISM="Chrysoculter rhomboideus, Strain RCC1486" /LENGTH=336 /DNA_ID=CAMNT_0007438089 /DNA_START=106 /DNA_END=1116 /DNA_ORIENTATION=-